MPLNSNSRVHDSDPYAALKARYPDAMPNHHQWNLLDAMQHYNWPRPATFPTDAQFTLAELFMPNHYDKLFMPNRFNARPIEVTDELANHFAELKDWADDMINQWGWYEDSPLTDAELASAENQAAWRDFTTEYYAAVQVIHDEIFGPGMSPKQIEFGDDPETEEWPLLDILSRLQVNDRPYYFRPHDALAPQRSGTLYLAGLALPYELTTGSAGLPWVKLDLFSPFGF
jgi:hypothetical protein